MGKLNLDKNYLVFGDNLDVMNEYIADESVDLIYLDPPFNSGKDYNILFAEKNVAKSEAQIKAFEDTWQWDIKSEETYTAIIEKNSNLKLTNLLTGMRKFLGNNDMMAYLVMMAIRLEEMKRVLKSTGSIYLHCDPTASHYLKLLMDAVFGGKNYLSEIIWCYSEREIAKSYWNKKHDTILFYSKSNENKKRVFNWEAVALSYSEGSIRKYTLVDEEGRKYQIRGKGGPYTGKQQLNPIVEKEQPEWTYRDYFDEKLGVPPRDWFSDIPFLNRAAQERLGYPTQKPEALLERIIKASSNEGDVVLDPFCGCGTTVAVAERLKRRWVGIDITHLAIALMEYRLINTFGKAVNYEVIGVPTTLKDAADLAQRDRFSFQSWAVRLIKAKPEPKAVADKGIDGRIHFFDDPRHKETKEIDVQVKSGTVNPSAVRDLKGTIEREKAQIGVLITLKEPTKGMKEEAASAGFYKSPLGKDYPKLQILTVKELLAGYEIKRPSEYAATDTTFKKAPRYREEKKMGKLPLIE